MSAGAQKVVRCAVYTRKSSEEGLDQAFNSLHAQREACEAYVKSQVGEGWCVLPTAYDDGGFSGGNMDRPALVKLLAAVDAGQVDTIIVYKVDRLTRSLPDFAKIVERLDAAGASFVSVTQAFNTTTSMGRLTLNVLLSFAQFEREVTGERIRDKIAASKARGMWMGGPLPLGYDAPTDLQTRALAVNPAEAEVVRQIFELYLELGSVGALEAHLQATNIRSKVWTSSRGRSIGGVRLSRGALYHLLQNRLYLGEIPHRDQNYPGAHQAIVEVELFDRVQEQLASQRQSRRDRPTRTAGMAFRGLLFNANGEPMCPSFAYGRGGKMYRYYVSAPLQQGRKPGSSSVGLHRVSAGELEEIVRDALIRLSGGSSDQLLAGLLGPVARIEIDAEEIRLMLTLKKLARSVHRALGAHELDPALGILTLPIRCRLRGGRTQITPPAGGMAATQTRRDPVLIRGLKAAHRLAAELGWQASDGALETKDVRAPGSAYDRKLLRLAFLAPDIQRAILDGRQPRDLSLERLMQEIIPLAWSQQRQVLGLS